MKPVEVVCLVKTRRPVLLMPLRLTMAGHAGEEAGGVDTERENQ